jgi:hypothetical protein
MHKYIFSALLAISSPFVVAAERTEAETAAIQQESVRQVALREYAVSKGIADGRRVRFSEMQQTFQRTSTMLDQLYFVDNLYMQPRKKSGNSYKNDKAYNGFLIQPPIVLSGEDITQIGNSGKSKEHSSVRYLIAAEAQFVSAPLYWQTFLVSPDDLSMQGPADEAILQPRTDAEKLYMANLYQLGLQEGRSQADMEMQNRIKTLTTMIRGMRLGRIFMDKGMMTEPQVTTQYVPTSGNNTQLTLDTRVAKIVEASAFVLDPSQYKAFVEKKGSAE